MTPLLTTLAAHLLVTLNVKAEIGMNKSAIYISRKRAVFLAQNEL